MRGPLGLDDGHTSSSLNTDPDDGAERDAWTILAAVDRLGPVAFAALIARYGSGRAILAEGAGTNGVQRLTATPALDRHDDVRPRAPVTVAVARAIAEATQTGPRILSRVRDLDLKVVTVEEAAYPSRLAAIAMPPHVLFVHGSVSALDRARAVAVVGTRRPTTGGRALAGRISTALVGASATVVSWLAFGIDGAAHEAAVRSGGTTVAVIGGGHAFQSPMTHRRLADAIVRAGGAVVSEHSPDIPPSRGTFPRRNRVISALGQATVVVEAPARSGALITASWALEQGRGCYLVPGALDAPASAGCLAFLREFEGEAHLVAGVPQLIADLGFVDGPTSQNLTGVAAAAFLDLGPTAMRLGEALVAGQVTVDELIAVLDLPVATVLAGLTLLERRGLAIGVHGRYRPAGALLGELPPVRLR
ncbi:MAG: DNA-protecting protein DprA [Chloroflexi bacterium]|nr:DNA-protecting protein DprA [Chloroflexota bacterium]